MSRENRLAGDRVEERHHMTDYKSRADTRTDTSGELPEQSVFRLRIKPDRRRAMLVVDPENERRRRPPGVAQ